MDAILLRASNVCSDQDARVKASPRGATKSRALQILQADAAATIVYSSSPAKNAKATAAAVEWAPDTKPVDDTRSAVESEFEERWQARRMGRRISHHGHIDDPLIPLYEEELAAIRAAKEQQALAAIEEAERI